jgi:hypothetical protein
MAFKLKSSGSYYVTFDDSGLTANRKYTLPDSDGVLGGGGGTSPIVVSKTANESVTNSTTLQDDNHLYYESFDSAKTYYIVFELMVTKTGFLTNPQLKFSFSAGANGAYYAPFDANFREAFYVTSITAPAILNNSAHPVIFYASLSGYSGTGKLMWAQASAGNDAITVMKYSKMTIYDLGTT